MLSKRDWVLVIIAILVIGGLFAYAGFTQFAPISASNFLNNVGSSLVDTNGRYFANDSTQTNDTRYVSTSNPTVSSTSARYVAPDDSKISGQTLTIGFNQINNFPICQLGQASISSGCVPLTGGGGTTNNYYLNPDGNVYSLGLLSDNNVWNIDLNTIGNLEAQGNYLCDSTTCYLISDLNSGGSVDLSNYYTKLDTNNLFLLKLDANNLFAFKTDLNNLVPYVGATQDVNLGGNSLNVSANGVVEVADTYNPLENYFASGIHSNGFYIKRNGVIKWIVFAPNADNPSLFQFLSAESNPLYYFDGNILALSNISGANLSGINTGDQNLEPYWSKSELSFPLHDANIADLNYSKLIGVPSLVDTNCSVYGSCPNVLYQVDANVWFVKQVDGNAWYVKQVDGNIWYEKKADFNADVNALINPRNYLTDAPSDGNTYGRNNGAWSIISSGSVDTNEFTAGRVNSNGVYLVDRNVGGRSLYNIQDTNTVRLCLSGTCYTSITSGGIDTNTQTVGWSTSDGNWNINLDVNKGSPELRLTDTNSSYMRQTRVTGSDAGTQYNRVYQPSGSTSSGLNFGSANYVRTSSYTGSLDITGQAITVAGWIWVNGQTNSVFPMILDKGVNVGYTFFIDDTSGSQLKLAFRIGAAGAGSYTVSSSNLSTGQWVHVAGTYDGSSIKVYINGVQNGTPQAKTGNIPSAGSNYFAIGASDSGTNTHRGKLDEVAVWSRVLTTTEIADLASNIRIDPTSNFPSTGTSEGSSLAGLYHMDEGTGTSTTADSSGNSNTGTMTNFVSGDWITGKAPATPSVVESTVWSSQDGTGAGEKGIQTFGDTSGRSVVQYGTYFGINSGANEKARFDVNGKLGLGTTTPQNTLNVVGDINATTNIYGANMYLPTNGKLYAGSSNNMSLYYDGTNGNWNCNEVGTGQCKILSDANQILNANSGQGIIIKNYNAGNQAQTRVKLRNNDSSVDVAMSATSTGFTPVGIFPASSFIFDAVAPNGVFIGNESSAPLVFFTGGTATTNERARFISTGELGIGTTTPTAGISVDVRKARAAQITPLALGTNNTTGTANNDEISTDYRWWNSTLTAGRISGVVENTSTNAGGLKLYTSATGTVNAIPSITLKSDNNVGINTTTPTSKLTVNGDANIGNKIRIKTDGNIIMTSPNGTQWNCGVTDAGIFSCN